MAEGDSPFTGDLDRRLKALVFLSATGFFFLVFRLFQLQVVRGGEMSRLADLNRTQIIPLQGPRGFVLDRNGEVLLDNVPSFSLLYSAESVPREAEQKLEEELVRWFPDNAAVLHKKIVEARRTGKVIRVFQGISHTTALALIEKRLSLPGINVLAEPKRRARYGSLASHLLGYVDEVGPKEVRRLREGFKPGQLIGKSGVERQFDSFLRGVDGGLQFEMDAVGHHVRIMQRIPSRSGADLVLSVDRRLQAVLEAGLEASPDLRGAAVAMDPRTGAVLALASYPDFDPTGNLAPYLTDPGLPLFNRVLQGGYPPGSVFKMVTAAAALQEVNWNIRHTFLCPGVYHMGKKDFACWKIHGLQDFLGAMAWSCNFYFYNVGLRVGPDAIAKWGHAFGLGQRTGIDLPFETAGLMPDRAWKKKVQGSGWFDGDTLNFSIGQGAVSVTPIQVAAYVSALANQGTLFKPYVVDRVVDPDGRVVFKHLPDVRRRIELSPEVLKTVRDSMEGVVFRGTGRGVWRPDLVVGGKTGTAQNPHGEDHAWFVSYAGRPGEAPSLVVVVIIEHGGHGATSAVPVARLIINDYFPLDKRI